MSTLVPITKEIFNAFLGGRGNMHEFVLPDAIVDEAIAPMVKAIEREYGIDAWFKNIGLVTIPLTDIEKARIRKIMHNAGYRAYISNEDMVCGQQHIEYCEMNLVRFDLAEFVSKN